MEEPAAHNGSAAGAAPGAGAAARPPATPEGMALAYGSLVLMALLPIFFGALRSVSCAKSKNSSEMPETITSRDAARFPIVASCTLLGLYLFFKIFSQEYINLLLSMYFFVLGILALSHTISPMMNRFFPANFPNKQYQLLFTQGSGESKEEIVNYEFDTKDLVCLALSSVVGVWYLLRKHWIANNLFGLAFSLNGVELLHLNNVFGTNVMVTVAKSFEAPIKLVFPQDLLEKGLEADNFAMLGLGDIVIPGIFIALLLRFDISLKKNTHTYFYTSFVAYIFGLGLTIFIMHIFKHAQVSSAVLCPTDARPRGSGQLGHQVPASCQEKVGCVPSLGFDFSSACLYFSLPKACVPGWSRDLFRAQICVFNSSPSARLPCGFWLFAAKLL
ncbi:minor histocompatibility antigen H13 isoform X4 [Pipra filicauda]|uniref:Minor histocompatibility antigen H13 isoform X4 n=1 Tax=Pipra filicauda TaxID=649802 RepID=A0A7R5KSX8_9PASS|nr:minor histocompatibility antigen H13 isoform X4 [Pipra filicauda]